MTERALTERTRTDESTPTSVTDGDPRATPVRLLALTVVPTAGALLAYLLLSIDVRAGLAVALPAMAAGFTVVWRRLEPALRAETRRLIRIGATAGVVATVAYDVSKFGLAELSGTDENPFGALPRFGALLLGDGADWALRAVAGSGFHLVNGVTFGIAFTMLVTRPTWRKGVVFGLVLELFQLALYPGWLDPDSFAEFASITAAGHIVYGAVLGHATARLTGRPDRHVDPTTTEVSDVRI